MHVLFKVDGRPLHVRALGAERARAAKHVTEKTNQQSPNSREKVSKYPRKPIFDKILHDCGFAAGRQGVGARAARAPALSWRCMRCAYR